MIIEVKRKHIRAGTRDDGYFCPVALACLDAGLSGIEIGTFEGHAENRPIDLPRSAVRFIHAFDAGRPVKPFRFKLNIPKP